MNNCMIMKQINAKKKKKKRRKNKIKDIIGALYQTLCMQCEK